MLDKKNVGKLVQKPCDGNNKTRLDRIENTKITRVLEIKLTSGPHSEHIQDRLHCESGLVQISGFDFGISRNELNTLILCILDGVLAGLSTARIVSRSKFRIRSRIAPSRLALRQALEVDFGVTLLDSEFAPECDYEIGSGIGSGFVPGCGSGIGFVSDSGCNPQCGSEFVFECHGEQNSWNIWN